MSRAGSEKRGDLGLSLGLGAASDTESTLGEMNKAVAYGREGDRRAMQTRFKTCGTSEKPTLPLPRLTLGVAQEDEFNRLHAPS
jgi:hypothetical protein